MGRRVEGCQETVADIEVMFCWGLSEDHEAVLLFAPKLICNGLGNASILLKFST